MQVVTRILRTRRQLPHFNSNNARSLKKRGGNCLLCLNASYAPGMGGQKVCLGGYMPPIPPPGSATGDKPNATTFIKPQLEFFIIKLCNFELVGGAIAPPCPSVATPLLMTQSITLVEHP